MDLKNFGKNLKFKERSLPETFSEKELFIDSITLLERCWNKSNQLYENFKINIIEYEEEYYQIIENLILLKYGYWKAEIIMWYLFGRIDIEGTMYPLVIQHKNKDDEKVFIKTPTELWNFLLKLEKQKEEDDK